MRLLLIAVAALMIAACQTAPPAGEANSLTATPSNGTKGFYGYATLGNTAAELELAPLFTTNALIRRTAARRLRGGRIDVGAAEQVQAMADRARALLDEARTAPKDRRHELARSVGEIQQSALTLMERSTR